MQKRDTILLVDDVEMNRVILGALFQDEYQLLQAENGEQALLLLKECHASIAVMLLDVVMPVKDGYQVLREMRASGLLDEVPVVVITAENSLEGELRAFDLGASDIIGKPFEPHVVTRRVRNIVELSQHKHNLECMVEEQAEKLRESNEIMIDALSSVIEYRSLESGQHIRRIRLLTKALLEEVRRNCPEYGLDGNKIDLIAAASAMHDIGKIAIPDSILNKPGRLTPEEFEIMKTHTVKGCEILESLDRMSNQEYLWHAYNICRYHHERWNGRGYPEGLSGDAIPISAQATGVADVYDALTSDRVYKKALPHDQAVNMILNGECGAFSPKLIECFKSVLGQFARLRRQYADGQTPAGLRLPPPDSVGVSMGALQMEQMKYLAVLRFEDATVAEVDFATGSYHLVYTGAPGVQALFQGNKLQDLMKEYIGSLVREEDQPLMHAIWEEEIPRFFSEGRFQQSWRYAVRDPSSESEHWCEMTVLRIDTEHPYGRKALLLFKTHPADGDTPRAAGGAKQLADLFDGTLLCRNDRWLTVEQVYSPLLGCTQEVLEERCGGRLLHLISLEDRGRAAGQIAQQLGAGAACQVECRITNLQGEWVWVLLRARRILDGGGERLLCAAVDISASKQSEDALRLSLERYRIIMEQTNDIIFEWDAATDRMTYSTNWKEKFGYEPIRERVSVLLPTVSHMHPEDMPRIGEFIKRMQGGAPYGEIDCRLSNAQGRYQWCRARATAQYDRAGRTCRVIGVLADINDVKQAQQALQAQAERDALTKLYNKQSARSRAEACLQRRGRDGAVLFIIDIDDFKLVNDRFGHLFGDAVLSKASGAIAGLFRGEDIVARIGGDEFMVVLQSRMDAERIQMLAGRIIDCFEQALRELPENCPVSCSVGAELAPQDGLDFETLFRRADMALYQAKAHGKNQFRRYDPAMEGRTFGEEAAYVRTEIESEQAADLSDLFLSVFRALNGAEDLDRAADGALALAGRRVGAGRAYICEEAGDGYGVTYEWRAPETEPLSGAARRFDRAAALGLFPGRDVFFCNEPGTLPPALASLLRERGTRSTLQCAFRRRGRVTGWVAFDDCERRVFWTRQQIDALQQVSALLSLFLYDRRLEQRAREAGEPS